MTVAELIEKLQDFDPTMRVVTSPGVGERAYVDIEVEAVEIAVNFYRPGEHASVDDWNSDKYKRHEKCRAVAIGF